jgi:hypothetical protein
VPKTKILTALHEAFAQTRTDADLLVERLLSIYRQEEHPQSTDQVVALGFLTCVRALREASLIEEIAIREEIQELSKLIAEVLTEVRRTEDVVRRQYEQQRRRGRSLAGDLSPSRATDPQPASRKASAPRPPAM